MPELGAYVLRGSAERVREVVPTRGVVVVGFTGDSNHHGHALLSLHARPHDHERTLDLLHGPQRVLQEQRQPTQRERVLKVREIRRGPVVEKRKVSQPAHGANNRLVRERQSALPHERPLRAHRVPKSRGHLVRPRHAERVDRAPERGSSAAAAFAVVTLRVLIRAGGGREPLEQRGDPVHDVGRRELHLEAVREREGPELEVRQAVAAAVLLELLAEHLHVRWAHVRVLLLANLERQADVGQERVHRLTPDVPPRLHAGRHVRRVQHGLVQGPVPEHREPKLLGVLDPPILKRSNHDALVQHARRGGVRAGQVAHLRGELHDPGGVRLVRKPLMHVLIGEGDDGQPEREMLLEGILVRVVRDVVHQQARGSAVEGTAGVVRDALVPLLLAP